MNFHEKNMTDLWKNACDAMLFATKPELDAWSGMNASIFNNVLVADSMEFDFDVGTDLWLTRARFPKLQRDYLQPKEVLPFIERCVALATTGAVKRGMITQMSTRPALFSDGSSHHNWGNCMMGFTYHGGKPWTQPTLTLFSRACYISYLGPLDMAVAYCLAKEIATRCEWPIEDFRFNWYLGSMQWHAQKGIPYIVSQGLVNEVYNDEDYPGYQYPIVQKSRAIINRFELDRVQQLPLTMARKSRRGVAVQEAGNYTYGPLLRMNKRYRRQVEPDDSDHLKELGGRMPSIPLSKLTLLPQMLEPANDRTD